MQVCACLHLWLWRGVAVVHHWDVAQDAGAIASYRYTLTLVPIVSDTERHNLVRVWGCFGELHVNEKQSVNKQNTLHQTSCLEHHLPN